MSNEHGRQRRKQCQEDRDSLGVQNARRPEGMWRRTGTRPQGEDLCMTVAEGREVGRFRKKKTSAGPSKHWERSRFPGTGGGGWD